jgi:uncharacterized cupin superfamily protein
MVLFECIVPSNARVPMPHYHEHVDEVVYGLEGVLNFYVGDTVHHIGPGDKCFVPRGIVHGFNNPHAEIAKILSVLTPASIGPAFFREAAAIVNAGGPPDPVKMTETLKRHGLIPAPLNMG